MILIAQNSTDGSVIDGTWLDTSTVSPAESGDNYTYDNGIFNDEISTINSRTWSFLPCLLFSASEFEITEEFNEGGVLLNRVTSGGSSRIYKLDSSTSGGLTKQKFHGFSEGGYGDYVASIILPMMVAEGAEWGLFNATATQWNRNCWGNSFDMSGIVTRSSIGSGWTKERGGFLITPRHVVLASHYQIGVGKQVQFIKKGMTPEMDQVIARTLIKGTRFPDQDAGFDNYIYLLDSTVPTGISPIPFCGINERAPGLMCGKLSDLVLKTGSDKSQLSGQGIDSGLSIFVNSTGGSYGSTYTRTGLPEYVAERIPFFEACAQFIRPVLAGDSGSPQLIVLGPTSVGFRNISSGATEASINQAIAAVDALAGISTGYTVTVEPNPTQ